MFKEENMVNNCPICYELLNDLNIVTLDRCNHKFCSTCTNELLFQEQVSCPLDREEISNIIIKSKTGGNLTKSLYEYQCFLVNDLQIMKNYMNNNWSICLSTFTKNFKILYLSLYKCKELLEYWLSRKSDVTIEEVAEFEIDILQSVELRNELIEESERIYERSSLIVEILNTMPKKNKTPFHIELEDDNQRIISMSILTSHFWTDEVILMLYNQKINQRKFIKEVLKNIKVDLAAINAIFDQLTWFIIYKVPDNRDLYKLHKPDIEVDVNDKCLICTKFINRFHFAKFAECNHKICLQCTKRYNIISANCPFDDRKLCNLTICKVINSENQDIQCILQYFEINHETINLNKTRNLLKIVIKLIFEILNFKFHVSSLIEIITKIQTTKKFNKIKKLLSVLRDQISQIQNSNYINFHSIQTAQMNICRNWMPIQFEKFKEKYELSNSVTQELCDIMWKCINFLDDFGELLVSIVGYDYEDILNKVNSLSNSYNELNSNLQHHIIGISVIASRYGSMSFDLLIDSIKRME